MTEANRIHIQLTEADYRSANQLHIRWTRWLWVYLGAIVGVIVAIESNDGEFALDFRTFLPFVIALAGITLWVGFVWYVLLPWRTRRIFRQQKQLHRPQTVWWDNDALSAEGEGFSVRTLWGDFLKWQENNQLFVIYHSDVAFRMFPKRAFGDERGVADFRSLLQTKIAPKPRQKRRT